MQCDSTLLGGLSAAFFLYLYMGLFIISTYFATAYANTSLEEDLPGAVPLHAKIGLEYGLAKTDSLYNTEQGSLLLESNIPGRYHQAPTVDTDVQMDITGLIARVTVTQRFHNPSSEWINGVYVFPLPEKAAVDHLRMVIGERTIEGKIKERKEAKRIYTQAKQEGKKASLVEQERPNIFTNSVANIGPGEDISVSIEYQQTLDYNQGQFTIRFPIVVEIRYIPGTQKVEGFNGNGWAMNTNEVTDASLITPPVSETSEGHDNPVSISVNLQTGFPLLNVESSYHAISKQMLDANHYQIELANKTTSANRDFVLSWRPQTTHEPQAALFTQDKDENRYALLMLMPPEIDWTKQQTLPKEMIYVIDISGSMSGESMQQARQALLLGLSQLNSEDWFNVIQFNSYTEAFSEQALPARENNIDRAKTYVGSLHADGGTEMADALNTALTNVEPTERIRQIIFLTDGSVGNEQALFTIIQNKLNNSRLFTVGIGSAPNSYFMSEAAALGRGTFTYVGNIQELKEKMLQLFHKLNYPVLSDLKLIWDDKTKADYWPNPIQDLYIGEPLVVSLKLPPHETSLKIAGKTSQSDWSTTLPINSGGQATGLNVLWARNKIQSLSQQISRGKNQEKIKHEITKLGLEHHIVTKHTSLVAVDITPSRPNEFNSRDKAVPVKKPHGWQMQIPQGATSSQLNLFLGAFLFLLAIGIRKFRHA